MQPHTPCARTPNALSSIQAQAQAAGASHATFLTATPGSSPTACLALRPRPSGCSAAGARLLWEQEVAGSIPATPTTPGVRLRAENVPLWQAARLVMRQPARSRCARPLDARRGRLAAPQTGPICWSAGRERGMPTPALQPHVPLLRSRRYPQLQRERPRRPLLPRRSLDSVCPRRPRLVYRHKRLANPVRLFHDSPVSPRPVH